MAREDARPSVLVVISHYLPGYRAGGPIRSVEGIVAQLGHEVAISIVTGDRDLGDASAYPGVAVGRWVTCGNARVMYLPRRDVTYRRLRHLVAELQPDVVYLNSLFSLRYMVAPALAARPVPVVVAPRGSLDPGALVHKRAKKGSFLAALRVSGLTRAVTWQATTAEEERALRASLGPVRIAVAANFPPAPPDRAPDALAKEPGRVRMIFLSRLVPKKNLLFALERLVGVRGTVELTVAGPLEDAGYWARCQALMAGRLPHVQVSVRGAVPHDEVGDLLARHHVLVLPTLGENFGHAILEALGRGLGVLISDRTPWHGLAALGAGWDLDLDDRRGWERALQDCCDMDQAAFSALSAAARRAPPVLTDVEETRRATRRLLRVGGVS